MTLGIGTVVNKIINLVLDGFIQDIGHKERKIDISAGDVVLDNLLLKASVVNFFANLPIQMVYGQIKKLIIGLGTIKDRNALGLQITIDGLNLLVESAEEEYEHKLQREKRIMLNIIDLATQKLSFFGNMMAGWTDGITTQIIGMVQIKIKNMHIRYEDNTTNPSSPTAIGITLGHIHIESYDDKMMSSLPPEEKINRIYKILELYAFSIYWNCKASVYKNLKPQKLIELLQLNIATDINTPKHYTYILAPVYSFARLILNRRPDLEKKPFVAPKVKATLEMTPVIFSISQEQYRDIIGLSDSMAFMARGAPFRKFRPNVPYKDHYKEWWHFAYKCILESEVRRRFNNFKWDHISAHLKRCKDYGKLYKAKMQSKKLTAEDQEIFADLERELDLMNIMLVRQKIKVQLEILDRNPSLSAMLTGWFRKPEKKSEDTSFIAKFHAVLTPEDKERFYKAISDKDVDIMMNIAQLTQPPHYVDYVIDFLLKKLVIRIYNKKHNVLKVQFITIKLNLTTRTSAGAISMQANIDEILVTGIKPSGGKSAKICNRVQPGALCDVIFELHPLNSKCTTRLHASLRPIKIIYDAVTINGIVDYLTIPRSSTLQQLSDVAASTFDNVKLQSTAKLQYLIDNHSQIDLKIDLHAPYVIIPYGGSYSETNNIIAINMGRAVFASIEVKKSTIKEKRLNYSQGQLLHALIEESYDQYGLKFSDFQVMVVPGGENWLDMLKKSENTEYHILYPLTLGLQFHICLVNFDPRLPKCKIIGVIPSLSLNITDFQLLLTVGLINSIPFPKTEETSPISDSKQALQLRRPSSQIIQTLNMSFKEAQAVIESTNENTKDVVVSHPQHTSLEVDFLLTFFCVNLKHQEYSHSPVEDVAKFSLEGLAFDLKIQTYAQDMTLKLENLTFNKYHKNEQVSIIDTPTGFLDDKIFLIKFLKVDKKSPNFATTYKSTETLLTVDFDSIQLKLHQEILRSLVQYANDLQVQLDELLQPSKVTQLKTSSSSIKKSLSEVISQTSQAHIAQQKSKPTLHTLDSPNILVKLVASLQEFQVVLGSDLGDFTTLSVNNVTVEVILKEHYTQLSMIMKTIDVKDLSPETKYFQILKVLSDEVVNFNVFLYNKLVDTSRREDMAVSLSIGQIQIVFLHLYVSKVLAFINKFTQAREAIIEASKAAADKAKQNVTSIYENATQMLITVDLKAPQVIIPERSTSLYALMCDLGHLKIQNNFVDLNIINENSDSHAILDEIILKLSDVQISRIESNQQMTDMVHGTFLLQPVNFRLSLIRNLSSSWYKSVPDIQISGHIDTIEVVLRQADYGTVMAILLGNLGEAVQEPVAESKRSSSEIKLIQEIVPVESEIKQTQSKSSYKEEEVTIFVKFSLIMKKFTLRLRTIDDAPKPRSGKSSRTNLAMFSLNDLCVKGRMMSDGAIHASVVIIECVIKDTRIGKKDKLNKMFSSAYHSDIDSTSTSGKSMFDVVYQQKKDQTYLDLKISGFNLILSMEFLTKLQTFLMSAFSEENASNVPSGAKTVSTQRAPSSKTINAATKSVNQIESKPVQNMTINIKMEKSDIVLVEHLNNIDTNALIVNLELLLKLRMCNNQQIINGLVKDIQIYTCCYNPAKREETKRLILFPFTINIAGLTPEGKGLHIEVCVTEIRIKISPATIELLNRTYTTMFSTEQNTQIEDDTFMNLIDLWDPKPYNEKEHWFLKTDNIDNAIQYVAGGVNPIYFGSRKKYELCIIRTPLFVINVEIGEDKATLPVLILEASFEGNVQDWSSNMSIDSTMTLEIAYYNSYNAVWEPLIEPIGAFYDNVTIYSPWELKLYFCMNSVGSEDAFEELDLDDEEPLISGQPQMSVVFSSKSNLEVTVSKSTLEALTNMSQAFSNAVNLTALKSAQSDTSPYKIINRSGLKVKIDCEKSNFNVFQQTATKEVILETGDELPLQLKDIAKTNYTINEIFLNLNVLDKLLYITVMQREIELNLTKSDIRYFSLNYRSDNDMWGIVVSTLFEENIYKVILSSIFKIYNHLHLNVDVYYITPTGLECVGSIIPEEAFYVPVNALYTPTSELFFSINKYSVTSEPYVWKYLHLKANQTQLLECSPMQAFGHSEPFVIKIIGSVEQIYNENTVKRTMNSVLCNAHIHPVLLFRNCLPYNIYLTIQNVDDECLIEPGCTLPMTNVIPGVSYIVLRLPNYVDKEWTCTRDILENPPLFSVWTFVCYDTTLNVSLDLGVHSVKDQGPLLMTLYCPFWMLNKSELNIAYWNSDENFSIVHHPVNYIGPVLFTFNEKNFFGKKKTAIRIENDGKWSDKFSIDVVGSSGVITCKYYDKIYQFGVNIEFTYNGLTKQVTFTPYYVLINNTPFPLECQEHDRPADPWTTVQPHSCAAFWPAGDFDDKLLRTRVVGTKEVSPQFYFSDSHSTVLKLSNKYGGIHVKIQITEGAVYITFAKYEAGMAPALIINDTRNTLNIWEKDTVQLLKLDPGHKMFYSWSRPSRARVVCWEAGYKKEIQDDLRKDGCGDYDIAEDNHVYWSSFLDQMQRILLFTCNHDIARNTQCSQIFQQVDREVTFSLFGLGLSLVNNTLKREIMYIAIGNSGIIWETCKHGSHRYKRMGSKDSAVMESSYKQYLAMKHAGGMHKKMVIDTKTEVNFETLQMLRPHRRKIRRTFLNGLWVHMNMNSYMLQLHAKINRIQIDNQDYDCMFPVVLAPVSLPKSVAGTDVHKPFAELSVVQVFIKHSQIKQFKYFKLLIQEFHINLEIGFVMAASEVFQTSPDTLEKQKASFLLDTEFIAKPLYQHVSQQSLQEQKSFYDLLHFSPLKIHMSFSLGSGATNIAPNNVITVLLQSLGVTLTDMQDVIFRIAYFEREYMFLTQKQLVSEATGHYIGQAVKQLYALVLGLDVLGNPYGFVLGITKGVEDFFYEPFQGAIQGPGEFVEGLALGVRSLFGHTVGGAAGAVSKITGAVGKGIAVLTFDKEFQRKRKEALKRKATVSAGFARSGKGLVMGVYDGVTGVIRKPISGAKEEGIGGFFKGLGKGAVGLVARPTSGVIDFASSSLDTVKRVTELTAQEVNRLRPRRYIHSDGFIKPYNETEATGNKILYELEKGKFARTDLYLHHFVIVDKKQILMLTDQRLLYIVQSDVFGSWQVEWSYTWNEIDIPPKVVPKGVLVTTAEPKRKKTFFAGADLGKTIPIQDSSISERICTKITAVHNKLNS